MLLSAYLCFRYEETSLHIGNIIVPDGCVCTVSYTHLASCVESSLTETTRSSARHSRVSILLKQKSTICWYIGLLVLNSIAYSCFSLSRK